MSEKKTLGLHVKQLLSDVSDHGSEHLREVETDLIQTTILLAEAIEKLGASFFALHEAVTSQQEEVNLIIAGGGVAAANVERLKTIQENISAHINAAVTSLQFQDLTNQLISRTVQRSVGLREVLATLGVVSNDLTQDHEVDDIAVLLSDVTQRLQEQSIQLKAVLRKAVNQKHLDSGDIELF